MKILYGVVGEGMGHATRSRVVLDHLVKTEKHEVVVVVSGRAHAYLKRYFPDVVEIDGLNVSYENNEVDRSRTVWNFFKRLPDMLSGNFEQFIKLTDAFAPDVVISDFESFAYTFGKVHSVPVISIDNMQVINRCALESAIPPGERDDFKIAKGVVKAKLPGCYHYLITSFFFPPRRKARTSLYPPILRDKILEAQPTRGDHLLVYQSTAAKGDAILDVLRDVKMPVRLYGLGRDETVGNIALRGFSEDGFVDDLASARGVVATGGFSLMGEAIYLGKPMLAIPLRKQFEQTLNCLYLESMGYGEHHSRLDPACVQPFCERLDAYAEALQGHQQEGNTKILAALDRLLAEVDDGRRAW